MNTVRARAMSRARQVKHLGFIAQKRLRTYGRALKFATVTQVSKPYSQLRPYRFDPSRYRRSFLARPAPLQLGFTELPHRVFVLWTGTNEMPDIRRRNLESLRQRIGVEVCLITPDTIQEWVVEQHPLHPAYSDLSLVHRSDYLRAYLLHHHGGGYCDVKRPLHAWTEAFARLSSDETAWISGFRELSAGSAVRLPGALGVDVAMHHARLIGTSAMITKSRTAFTGEWLREVERRLDYYGPQLREFPGGERGNVVGYPISWTHLLGGIYQPLQLKYLSAVRQEDSLLLDFENYL
ncbi:capsular polysaccharide synthesis protein [Tessaracoccus sp. Z1128]